MRPSTNAAQLAVVAALATRDEVVAGYRAASLRVIAAHMIEETARHAGQSDILREQIDGVTDD
jgi:Protein of unknown function (DUF664)